MGDSLTYYDRQKVLGYILFIVVDMTPQTGVKNVENLEYAPTISLDTLGCIWLMLRWDWADFRLLLSTADTASLSLVWERALGDVFLSSIVWEQDRLLLTLTWLANLSLCKLDVIRHNNHISKMFTRIKTVAALIHCVCNIQYMVPYLLDLKPNFKSTAELLKLNWIASMKA